jgi:hypothetical protein
MPLLKSTLIMADMEAMEVTQFMDPEGRGDLEVIAIPGLEETAVMEGIVSVAKEAMEVMEAMDLREGAKEAMEVRGLWEMGSTEKTETKKQSGV